MARLGDSMSRKDKERLEPFAEDYERLVQSLEAMDDVALEGLSVACANVSQTNCGWSTYRAAKVLQPEISSILLLRKRNAQESMTHQPAGIEKEAEGRRIGGEPEDEAENFYDCPTCGAKIDKRDLAQVFRHEAHGDEQPG